ncbi:outer membrane lipoprotein-sorting protein [Reichenbachiella sp.]|uniref:outer membrane lipoprotein-sorting protein n=1 Tax=Reichenbachiella sp. TaxID=2184521 RepID=UPI003B5B44EB
MIKTIQSLSLICIFIYSAAAQDPKDIIQKSLDKVNGKSSQGEMEMTIVRPRYTRTMTMKSWSLGREYFLIYITGPARDKGQVFLKRQTDMWNWIPNISRMIKLPPSMMGQNWMGSDFTNDDLVKMNSLVDDYTHKLLGEEKIDGIDCYQIEMIPKPNSSVVWGKINIWIGKDEYYQMKAEYYDEDFELVSTMEASNITQFDDRKLPAKMVMTPINKPGNQTIMINKNLKFDTDLKESFFSQQNMKRVR